jgi:hypothetical protein
MKPPTHIDNLLQYTAFAANTVGEIAGSFEIPFLGSTATLVLEILKCVEVGVVWTATKYWTNWTSLLTQTRMYASKWWSRSMKS